MLAGNIVSAARAAQQDRLGRIEESEGDEAAPQEGFDSGELVQRLDELAAEAVQDFDRVTSALGEMSRRLEKR
ncbi:hypothetical protein Misp01_67360 [Microtetraspora sp. NBRC 13810]|uniref:hypothetical protein n=1 Tax=Microtetraspora sp. NBRC 13810 TaxID=3030990 RepID=UPI0024A0E0FA|nr:hypothetical protein [Microtetraspora sp. NBRC 13810]GLW11608.1 hypothetical protein Misp01_67360 [Microtetraspora sp. NBRC 13810]